jgi:LysM repeat protein
MKTTSPHNSVPPEKPSRLAVNALALYSLAHFVLPSCTDTEPQGSASADPGTPPQPGSEVTPKRYTVQAGDTLSKIGGRFDISVEELVQANNLPSPDRIYIDQELVIPPSLESGGPDEDGKLSRKDIALFARSLADPEFGEICRAFESNNDLAARAHIPGDPGGVSFGCYQVSSKTMPEFIRFLERSVHDSSLNHEVRTVARKALDGFGEHATNSDDFHTGWREVSRTDPRDFGYLQQLFIILSHLEPTLVQANKLGLPISREMAEVYLSISVQHSPKGIGEILRGAVEMAPPKTSSVSDITSALYQSRRSYVESIREDKISKIEASKLSDEEKKRAVAVQSRLWGSVLRRFDREEEVALDVVRRAGTPPNI